MEHLNTVEPPFDEEEYLRIIASIGVNPTNEQIAGFDNNQILAYNYREGIRRSKASLKGITLEKQIAIEERQHNEDIYKEAYNKWVLECKRLDEERDKSIKEWRQAVAEANRNKIAWDKYVEGFREAKNKAVAAKKPKQPCKEDYL